MTEEKHVIKFTADHEVQDEHAGTERATVYKKGQRKSLPASSCEHFINRGKAVMVRSAKAKS